MQDNGDTQLNDEVTIKYGMTGKTEKEKNIQILKTRGNKYN